MSRSPEQTARMAATRRANGRARRAGAVNGVTLADLHAQGVFLTDAARRMGWSVKKVRDWERDTGLSFPRVDVNERSRRAAAAITDRPQPAPEVPWFWSDQYDLKLQIAGLPLNADRQIVRGDPGTSSFAVFHLSGDRIVCVEAVNAPPEFMAILPEIAQANCDEGSGA